MAILGETRLRPAIGYAAITEWAGRLIESFSRWLTLERATAYLAIAAIVVWLRYVFNLTTPGLMDRAGHLKGADFLQFYTAGMFVKMHQLASLYDVQRFLAVSQRAVPGAPNWWSYLPVYPPQIAFLFWPFSYMSYVSSYLLFSALNMALYGACVMILAKLFPGLAHRGFTLVALAMAFPPFFDAVAYGQVSIIVLTCIIVALWGYLRGNGIIAGTALGCTALKPPIFVSFVVALVAVQAIDLIGGMVIGGLAQLGFVLVFAGFPIVKGYAQFAATLPRLDDMVLNARPYQMHSLRSFWMLLGAGSLAPILWLASSTLVLVILARYWRRQTRPDLRFGTLVVAAVLIDPHLYIYDAVILLPTLAISITYALEDLQGKQAATVMVAIYMLFVTLLLGPLSRVTHFQLSVLVLMILLVGLTAKSEGQAALAAPQSDEDVG